MAIVNLTHDQLPRGTQIAMIPDHANGSLSHKDVEYGFVFGECEAEGFILCRYWRSRDSVHLRTIANSEASPIDHLVLYDSHPQDWVNWILSNLNRGWPIPGKFTGMCI